MEPFGRYLLLRRLAEGGMGELFLAQQAGIAGFAKQLVVKRIKPALAGDPTFIEMFLHEGRIAALIDHPNVVQIHELGEVDSRYFIAMEYVPGRSLASILEELGGPLELSIALYVMLNLCEGLAFAHAATGLDGQPLGLVHRDISPPNVLLGYSGSVKLSDFGIAKVQHTRHTEAGVLKGKFAYLSPEQARGESVDARSDIYALGLLLFEITVGRRANPAPSDTGMVFAAARGQVIDPGEASPDYPEPLRRVFLKATALRLEDRYASVKELQEDLLNFQLDQRLVTTAGRVGEWLGQLPRSQVRPEAETAAAIPAVIPAPPGSDPHGLAASEPTSPPVELTTVPKVAFAPTVQAKKPGEVELDLASEGPSWHRRERADNVVMFQRGGHGFVVAVIIISLVLAGGAAFVLHRALRPRAESPALVAGTAADRGVSAMAAIMDASPTRASDQSRLTTVRLDAGPARVSARSVPAGAPPAARHSRVPDAGRGWRDRAAAISTSPESPPTQPADAHVYWTERGPVLP